MINGNTKIEDNFGLIKIIFGDNLDEERLKTYVKVKEYDYKGRLLFDGEYFNEKKWKGKLKVYSDDILVFEGDYLDGKIWNCKGKIYNFRGDVIFDGEIKNGLKDGNVKEYYDNDQLKFDGNYLKGEKNGNAKEYDIEGNLLY